MADTARYKKIDIYCRATGKYLASTNQAINLAAARARYAESHGLLAQALRAEYAKHPREDRGGLDGFPSH